MLNLSKKKLSEKFNQLRKSLVTFGADLCNSLQITVLGVTKLNSEFGNLWVSLVTFLNYNMYENRKTDTRN